MHSIKRTVGSLAVVGTLFLAGAGCSSSGNKASFCKKAKQFDSQDLGPSDGKKFTDLLAGLKSDAPSDIKGDVTLYLDALTSAATTERSAAEKAKLTKASEHIKKYLKDECDIKVG